MTTVTTSKKKLVYKQDPDGVFRLKRLGEDDKLSTKSDKRTVDDYVNDLVTCTYKVLDPNKPEPIEEDVVLLDSGPLTVNTQPLQSPTPTHSPVKERPQPPRSPIKSPVKSPKEPSPGLNITIPDTLDENPPPSQFSLSTVFSTNSPVFHIPSFGLGLIIALIASRFSTIILQYSKVAFDYLKIGVFWGIILGAIGWYAGVVKVQELSSIINKFKNKEETIKQEEPELNYDILQNESHDFPKHHTIQDYMEDSPPPIQRSHSGRRRSRPKNESRRNTVTNVMPFKPQQRLHYTSDKSPSVPNLYEKPPAPKLTRFNTAEPKLNYSKFVERSKRHRNSNSIESIDSNYSQPIVHNNGPRHPLPSLPDEDLPFVNEVVLQTEQEPLKRMNTTASKKSVLGTRANYNRFLENVQHLDYD